MTRVALITGVTGQDGSYLADLLLSKGYEVHGLIRRSSSFNTARLNDVFQDPHVPGAKLHLHYSDLTDGVSMVNLIREIGPSEVYHLAAQSHVRVSFDLPVYTGETTALGTTRLLEAIRAADVECKFYQASSSELYGSTPPPQNESSPFHPRSPYGVSKLYSYWSAVNYRESYGLFATNGILFNHESPRRGETFVTRKITRAVAKIAVGLQDRLYLGNLEAVRDWGYAPEYVEGMWKMLQLDAPDDFVLATGVAMTVREFCEIAFERVGLSYQDYVEHDSRYERPAEVDSLIGDASKARQAFGWNPRVIGRVLVETLVDADLELLNSQLRGDLPEIHR